MDRKTTKHETRAITTIEDSMLDDLMAHTLLGDVEQDDERIGTLLARLDEQWEQWEVE